MPRVLVTPFIYQAGKVVDNICRAALPVYGLPIPRRKADADAKAAADARRGAIAFASTARPGRLTPR